MRIELGQSGIEESVERIELPYSDEVLHDVIHDEEINRQLYENDPVLWMRIAVGVDTGRGASYVTDRELAERYDGGGFAEWDPKVAQAVRDYLYQNGYIGLRGTSER